ncbi:MAG: AmmeMemoRadiSam system radical SAM enzyme [Candidatus Cloacimonetes bacterium]|jgi:pyruvate formate lyase activating enzyme|nr:AmmeMemoRadiSam system radical SAM enzyme [Candidatus Cloacimonadota bacterium]MCB5286766.1 AmmeMemoRadiSam system radical SAM enzyme [Candidatus Cloacimonadota bacterium]MCK9184193.1 AmmeMemoRadiSam system radical SAM enzyme [Candidatus Cloacimonadota bacterium]MCK9583531.1 AmmeMemoRadiSam system radical SAM enzyme [Candidatus Cloacimonadota bacterium]MDY0229087.1 AmmeMemoRadiSam system radical SAM enzyme [Candidatus Cloacimonadaceae bacterium]
MSELIREAMYYKKLEGDLLQCELCPHYCVIPVGEMGKCRSRENIAGKLWAVNYAQALGISVDPIEKKPFYHFRPGSNILSLGPNSCNLKCRWCQNYQISQFASPTIELSLEELYSGVLKHNPTTRQLAFTYTEPLTWYEYILDFATMYPEVKIALISNGFLNPEPLAQLLPHIAAMNIDLKGFTEGFYKEQCGGSLEPIKTNIRAIWEAGVHLELTLLLIPGLNDKEKELCELVNFIASISPEIPLHISAYHPTYLTDLPATRVQDIARARQIALKKLSYVYGGNLAVDGFRDCQCPDCGKILMRRTLFSTDCQVGSDNKCPHCGRQIYGQYDQ